MTHPPAIADEILTESAAVERIPGRDATVRAWLRGLGIARQGPSGVVYRWSEILAALAPVDRPAPKPVACGPVAPRVRL